MMLLQAVLFDTLFTPVADLHQSSKLPAHHAHKIHFGCRLEERCNSRGCREQQ